MAKAVLTTRVESSYDDVREVRYHFPRTYLRAMEATVGDWIVYYEPRRLSDTRQGGRMVYFAIAKVERIEPDPRRPDHFYAHLSGYLEFARAVPFQEGDFYYESALRRPDGRTSKGAFGRAVRLIPDAEFELILQAGFAQTLGASVPAREGLLLPAGFGEAPATFDRPVIERLVARPFRDAAFAAAVKEAYEGTCAVTGIRLINGGGRTEVQAAHIRPVADRGPDSVRNGIALSGTIHWMFDRGLISITDDYRILLAKGRVPDQVEKLVLPERRLRLPANPNLLPHPQFLRYHRARVFIG
ncbi:MAG: HNH endonuclease [Rhodospirillaceae bacterium]|nr:HNH endonuclease [Rhodospirillaceae bacterium]